MTVTVLYTLPKTSGTPAARALEDAFVSGTPVTVEFVLSDDTAIASGDTKGFTGSALIVDFPLEAPHDDSVTFSLTLQGTGALAEVTVA